MSSTSGVDCVSALGACDDSRLGFTWKVEKEPDDDPLFGGLPRPFPADRPLLFGQADETAGPCRLLARLFSSVEGVTADRGSADMRTSDGRLLRGMMAD